MIAARRVALVILVLWSTGAAVSVAENDPTSRAFGVLVMAHGGSPGWNQGVLDAVDGLRDRYPVEVAFGMADACSIAAAVRNLEEKGVSRIGVVRLFVSGESWYERTEQILGLRDGAPAAGEGGDSDCAAVDPAHAHHSMKLFRIASESSFAVSRDGLLDAPEMGTILAERARGLSRDPAREDVLILAHGPGDDAENERWLAALEQRAATVRAALPFHRVAVDTLREDWPEKRKLAQERIRAWVAEATGEGRRVIVLPYRLFGFGPFAEVLAGQSFAADELGLLPHVEVTRWIRREAEALDRATAEAKRTE